jgi:hypothetical protein
MKREGPEGRDSGMWLFTCSFGHAGESTDGGAGKAGTQWTHVKTRWQENTIIDYGVQSTDYYKY